MKIEKISSTQIRVVLNRRDLEERNIRRNDLELSAYGSEKAREFFREIMEEAVRKFDFAVENIPLMIEAISLNNDEIMLLVSKVTAESESGRAILEAGRELGLNGSEVSINMTPKAVGERLFIRREVEALPEEITLDDVEVFIFSFESLDQVTGLCSCLASVYSGESTLYKENGAYYLVIARDGAEGGGLKEDSLEALACEYGTRHISNDIAKAYLEEHGEIIVRDKAVKVLSVL